MTITPDELVRREVYYCVSSLVSSLADARLMESEIVADLAEQAFELATPVPDYEEAATQAGWKHGGDFDGFWFNSNEFDSWKAAASSNDAATYASAQAVCESENIEPYDREVFEHWIVSDWLADKLAEKGEKVDKDFAGMTIWARTTTGQAIYCDGVMEDIAADLNKREPRP